MILERHGEPHAKGRHLAFFDRHILLDDFGNPESSKDFDAVSTATLVASSHDLVLVPTISMILYTLPSMGPSLDFEFLDAADRTGTYTNCKTGLKDVNQSFLEIVCFSSPLT